jgi:Tfp pilus assembly protein PilF
VGDEGKEKTFYQDIIEQIESIQSEMPNDYDIQNYYGLCLYNQNKLDLAFQKMNEALKIAEPYQLDKAINNLVVLSLSIKQYTRINEILTQYQDYILNYIKKHKAGLIETLRIAKEKHHLNLPNVFNEVFLSS